MHRVAIYCRVSTEGQEQDGTSLQTQAEACREYCHRKGYEVSYTYIEAYSGLSLQRPQLDQMREAVRGGAFDVVCDRRYSSADGKNQLGDWNW